MQVIEIPEAFVNFCDESDVSPCAESNAGCVEIGACYPMYDLADLHFQVLLGDLVDNEADLIIAGDILFKITLARTCDECLEPTESTTVANMTAKPWETSGGNQNDFFVLSSPTWINTGLLASFSEGECFVLCLWKGVLVEGPSPIYEYTKLGCSPCFIRYTETCDTSIIYYRNNENSFGFYNSGDSFYDTYYNSIRLPFKLHKPQVNVAKNVYRKSDGNYIKNSATGSREWAGLTELISELWHMKLTLALNCDQLKITNENSGFSQKFFMSQEDNDYKVDWLEAGPTDYPHAQATFKLMEMPFNEFNNNCNIDPVVPNGVIINDQDGNSIGSVACGTEVQVKVYDADGNLLYPTFSLVLGVLTITGIDTAMIVQQTGVTTTFTNAALIGKTLTKMEIIAGGTEQRTIDNITSFDTVTGIITFTNDLGGQLVLVTVFN